MGKKKPEAMRAHENNEAPENRKMQKIPPPPPRQTTDLSGSAAGTEVAVGLLLLIRYGICSLPSKGVNLITVSGWGELKYPQTQPGLSIEGVGVADLHSEGKQRLPGRGTVQQMEERTQRAQPLRDIQDAARPPNSFSTTAGRFLGHPQLNDLQPQERHWVYPHPAPAAAPGGSPSPFPFPAARC